MAEGSASSSGTVRTASAIAVWISSQRAKTTGTSPRPRDMMKIGPGSTARGSGGLCQTWKPSTVSVHRNGRRGPPGNAGVKSNSSRRLKSGGTQPGSLSKATAPHPFACGKKKWGLSGSSPLKSSA